MKSTKKRFKEKLVLIERLAADLLLLSADVSMFEPVCMSAENVLRVSRALRMRTAELDKKGFVDRVVNDENLLQLEDCGDEDVISEVERRFSLAFPNAEEKAAGDFLRQMLNKLEARHALMQENIQQLSGLLNVG